MNELSNKPTEQVLASHAIAGGQPAPADASATGPEPADAKPWSLLDEVLNATPAKEAWLGAFLAEPDWLESLKLWLSRRWAAGSGKLDRQTLGALLDTDIARLDHLLNDQANAILHHPTFQKLESSWRGLSYVVDEAAQDAEGLVMTRVLNASWSDLGRDAERALEFDQTHFWRKVYEEEYGSPGGVPFGVLIGDYQVCHRPSAKHPTDDVSILRSIAQTAAAAFVPFITGADPSLLGLDNFGQLERHIEPSRVFNQPEYTSWNALRREPDMKFVGITAPRTLMRVPYRSAIANVKAPCCPRCGRALPRIPLGEAPCPSCSATVTSANLQAGSERTLGFRFRENVEGHEAEDYLWGNAAYALGGVLIRAFSDSRWLADIRGFDRNQVSAGVVHDLPSHTFGHDREGVAPKMGTDVAIDDSQEKALSDFGLIPLSHCHDTDWHVFYSNNSLHQPAVYDDAATTLNARIASMLQYTFCASRFAHYLKVQMRERIQSRVEAMELQSQLIQWINSYVTQDSLASSDVKARFPLREAEIEVFETPGQTGSYHCGMKLWPHYQLDEVSMSIRMVTQVSESRRV